MAAFMACGHAKYTGEVGLCIATFGPGAIHLLNGLYDAKLDHAPVVAIVGQQKRISLGADYQQEVDLQMLFKDVSEFVQTCMEPAQARHLVDRAVRVALDRKGVVTLIFPNDVPWEEGRDARRPGCAGAGDEIVETAQLLGAGVAKALLGKAVLPDDLPFVTGSIGLLGTTASYELMSNCDTLFR
jgi:pyruvate dehydrogenase (quinone)